MRKLTGFRVDFLVDMTQHYAPYTYPKLPVTREMAQSLGDHLKRIGSAGRIVDVTTGEIISEWKGK